MGEQNCYGLFPCTIASIAEIRPVLGSMMADQITLGFEKKIIGNNSLDNKS